MRSKLVIHVGNLLELVVAGVICWAVWRLAGLTGMLIAIAVLGVVFAESTFDEKVIRVPLPRRPRPIDAARRVLRR